MLFQGMIYNGATGTYDDRMRVLDPDQDVFLSVDPMGYAAGDANLYRYVSNNPLMNTDPSGMSLISTLLDDSANTDDQFNSPRLPDSQSRQLYPTPVDFQGDLWQLLPPDGSYQGSQIAFSIFISVDADGDSSDCPDAKASALASNTKASPNQGIVFLAEISAPAAPAAPVTPNQVIPGAPTVEELEQLYNGTQSVSGPQELEQVTNLPKANLRIIGPTITGPLMMGQLNSGTMQEGILKTSAAHLTPYVESGQISKDMAGYIMLKMVEFQEKGLIKLPTTGLPREFDAAVKSEVERAIREYLALQASGKISIRFTKAELDSLKIAGKIDVAPENDPLNLPQLQTGTAGRNPPLPLAPPGPPKESGSLPIVHVYAHKTPFIALYDEYAIAVGYPDILHYDTVAPLPGI